jgi:2-polyprenyl-3-methyl-5-hydroxy-6-metoxy-1,4-benzoquinol methylase
MDGLTQFKAAQRASWAHFTPLQAITTGPAARLVRHSRLASGARVLDAACGTGVVAVTAARAGARVTGFDLTLSATDPAQLAAFRADLDALTAEYFADNVVRQGYLMTRTAKV